jgi:hypothetical protein
VTHSTESSMQRLGHLDPAMRFRCDVNEEDVELRIQRILRAPLVETSVIERPRKALGRPLVCGLALSLAMAIVTVLMWASPAEGEFARGHAPAAANASLHATPFDTPRGGQESAVMSAGRATLSQDS